VNLESILKATLGSSRAESTLPFFANNVLNMAISKGFSFSLFVCFTCSACAVGRHHTSDAKLERGFIEHRTQFEYLLAEVQADPQLKTILPKVLMYAGGYAQVDGGDLTDIERLGMRAARWTQYQKELKELGLNAVMKGGTSVAFRVDPPSLWNGDSYKGYLYDTTRPRRVLPSLDGYTISQSDHDASGGWTVFKSINGNWYIFLSVSS
jgi:hypothetical protein